MIHHTALLYGIVEAAADAYIGPYCIIGGGSEQDCAQNYTTKIGDGCEIHSHSVIGAGADLGAGAWCDHHCLVGECSVLERGVEVMYGARIYDRVKSAAGAWIGGFVCNDAIIGTESIVLGNLVHRFVDAQVDVPEPAPVIGDRCFVGFGAIVIGGVTIGDGAYVAAGAVVTGDIPPGRLFSGVPARDIDSAPVAFRRWRTDGTRQGT